MSAPLTPVQVHEAAIEAASQVDSIAAVLIRLAPEARADSLLDESLVRLLGLRLQALAGVLAEFIDFGEDEAPEGNQLKHAVLEVYGSLPGGDDE